MVEADIEVSSIGGITIQQTGMTTLGRFPFRVIAVRGEVLQSRDECGPLAQDRHWDLGTVGCEGVSSAADVVLGVVAGGDFFLFQELSLGIEMRMMRRVCGWWIRVE